MRTLSILLLSAFLTYSTAGFACNCDKAKDGKHTCDASCKKHKDGKECEGKDSCQHGKTSTTTPKK